MVEMCKLEVLKPYCLYNKWFFLSTYTTYEELEKDYLLGVVHPGDLKTAVALALNKLIEPVRRHFQINPEAKQLLE